MIKEIMMIFLGFASGVLIAAGTFAFIAAIGIVPRMAQRTKTQSYVRWYEDAILLGGLFGTAVMYWDIQIPMPVVLVVLYGLFCGIFVGVLTMALAEVLNVMPILMRRLRLSKGITWFVVSFALGKFIGALLYFCVDGFYVV